ncbi:MAG TPA: hypothetical protein PL130_05710 [Dictyoglomaceae bacterium]|nr:hypothetical protein [Dictyoglomaceae bacterium]HPU43977.1 hypothetical protein [Dictyoglomaceae bacterium]
MKNLKGKRLNKKVFWYLAITLLISILFLSGCARTVTPKTKGMMDIILTLTRNVYTQEGNVFIVVFSDEVITTDTLTWKYFIWYNGDFTWGTNGVLDLQTPPNFKPDYDLPNNKFSFKEIPLGLFRQESGVYPENLHMRVFYYYFYQGKLETLIWSSQDISFSIEPQESYPELKDENEIPLGDCKIWIY